ncbi:MAG: thiamine pyrophosphate-binding protein [Actinobacteria bacterium]|nr:thiamine pyrophosphate-binding protein [Actinomycetota bacterium]
MEEAAMKSGGAMVAEALKEAGVEVVFGLPGIHNMGIWPHLGEVGIKVLGSRHEQGTAYAADGYARATGKLGAAITTTGPGAANTIGAVGEAWASKSPLLMISTDIPSTARAPGVYRGFVHECVDQPGMFRPVTKATIVSRDPDDVAEAIATAAELAMAPPRGPVYVEFPADFLDAPSAAEPRPPAAFQVPAIAAAELDAAAELIALAERPLIWVGGGGRDASAAIDSLATTLGAPILTTFQARGILPADHPLLLGLPPHEPRATALLESADAVVVIGSDLDQMMTQAWRLPLPRRRLAVNIDGADATKNYEMDVVLVGEAADVTGRLVARLGGDRAAWAGNLREIERETLAELGEDPATAEAAEFLGSVGRALPPEAIVFADMAVPGYWLSGLHRVERKRALHYPMGWGTLGFAFPASIGAAAGLSAPVVSFNGDGGILFALGELAAVVQEALPLTVVVVDDGGYGMLRYGKDAADNRFGTELRTPDFAAIARGFGLTARATEGVGAEFEAALAEAIASEEANLLVTRAKMEPPRTTSPRWPLRDVVPAGRD